MFVQRDGAGRIVGVFSNAQPGIAEEWVDGAEVEQSQSVPERVTMRQARLALLGAGLLEDVEAALAALEGTAGQAARIEWEYSQEVWRNKPFVQQVASSLGMSDAQLDQMFITAAGIE